MIPRILLGRNNDTMILQPYDWNLQIRQDYNEILCWCLSKGNASVNDNEKVLVRIYGCPSVCYMQLPTIVGGDYREWSEGDVAVIQRVISSRYGESAPYAEIIKGRTLYYYKAKNISSFLKLSFKSDMIKSRVLSKMKGSINIPGIGEFPCIFMEDDDITGNVILSLISDLGMGYSQFFKFEEDGVNAVEVHGTEKITTVEVSKEFVISERSAICPMSQEETLHFRTNPGVLCMDIETRTEKHNSFPNANIDSNCSYMISCIYQRFMLPETLKKILLVLGEIDPISGVEVRSFKSEFDLIRGYELLVKELNPEIITGYNIFAYDFRYLNIRLKRWLDDWTTAMSLLRGVKPVMYEKEWFSSAYQNIIINYPEIHGRVYIDMLTVIKREYKLPRYKLDAVAKKFLGEGKHDVPAKEMFEIYDLEDPVLRRKEMSRVGAYCVQDSVLVLKLFEKFSMWYSFIEQSNINDVPMSYLTTRGQQIRIMNKIIREVQRRRTSGDVIIIDKMPQVKIYYAGAFVRDPRLGRFRNVLTWDFASLYPSILMAYNMCFTTIVRPDQNSQVPADLALTCSWTDRVTKKQLDHAAKKGNMEVDLPVGDELPDDAGNDNESNDGDEAIPAVRCEKDTVYEFKHEYKFVKPEIYKGILPTIVEVLVSRRKEVRDILMPIKKKRIDEIKKLLQKMDGGIGEAERLSLMNEKASLEVDLSILNSRQLALKVTANSVYGFTGAISKGMLPCIEVGTSITSMGRNMIGQVYKYVLEHYPGSIDIYGDTDSCMFDIGIKDPRKCYEMGEKIAKELTALFPPPVKMEFEKAFSIFVTFTKKNYAGVLLNKKGEPMLDMNDIFIKGLPPVRRDFSDWVKEAFLSILMVALKDEPITKAFSIVEDYVLSLKQRSVPPEKLVVTTVVKKDYKNPSYPTNLFKQYYERLGRPLDTDDRVAYIVIDNGFKDDYKGNKMRLLEHYQDLQGTPEHMNIDVEYYLVKVLTPQVKKLLRTAFSDEIGKYDSVMHAWPSVRERTHFTKYCSNYVESLQRIMQDKEKAQGCFMQLLENRARKRKTIITMIPPKPKTKIIFRPAVPIKD